MRDFDIMHKIKSSNLIVINVLKKRRRKRVKTKKSKNTCLEFKQSNFSSSKKFRPSLVMLFDRHSYEKYKPDSFNS